jgi:hypothetical protein
MLRFITVTMSSPGPGHQFRYDSVDLSLVRGQRRPLVHEHHPAHTPSHRQVVRERHPRDPGSADDDFRRALAHDGLIVPQSGGPADGV